MEQPRCTSGSIRHLYVPVYSAYRGHDRHGDRLRRRSEREVWLMPFGALLDQWEIYRQFNGLAKPRGAVTIDDVIPEGI